MITVSILINGHPLYVRSAVNVSPTDAPNNSVHQYKMDTGDIIKHKRSDGAVTLAKRMLETIEEL